MTTINANTPQLEAVQRWIDAYCSLDLRRIELLFSKDFKHRTLPRSIGRPEETREAYLKRFGEVLPMFTSFNTTIHEVIEAPGKAVVHATDVCPTVFGVTLTYETTYTMTFVEEDGEVKFARIQEFIDSQGYNDFFAKISKAGARQKAAL